MQASPAIRRLTMVLVALAALLPVHAQEELETTISSEGTATIEVEPAVAVFRMVRSVTGATTVAAAAETALGLETALKESLAEKSLIPESVEMMGVRVVDIETKTVETSATIRFPLEGATPDSRAKNLAALCDDVASVAKKVECKLEGPFLEPLDREAQEQVAITRATENALYKADAAAAAMQSRIEIVRTAVVEETSWDTEGPLGAVPADSLRLLCHARVKMVYKIQY